MKKDGSQVFVSPEIKIVEAFKKRMTVADTDNGLELMNQVHELKMLVTEYRKGTIKETE